MGGGAGTRTWIVTASLLAGFVRPAEAASPAPRPAELRDALDAVEKALATVRADLQTRVAACADSRLRALLKAGSAGAELPRRLAELRKEAGLDGLCIILNEGGGPARLVLGSEDLAVRARAERDPLARELAALPAAGPEPPAGDRGRGGGWTSFMQVPEGFLVSKVLRGSAEAAPRGARLVLLAAAPVGKGSLLLGGVRMETVLDLLEGSPGENGAPATGISAFDMVDAPAGEGGSDKPAPRPRIIQRAGAVSRVSSQLVTALSRSDRARGAEAGDTGAGGAWRGEWLALRDLSGRLVGGLGTVAVPVPAATAVHATPGPAEPRVASPLGVLGGILSVAILVSLLAWALWQMASFKREIISEASEALASGARVLSQELKAQSFLGPLVERSVERAAARTEERLVCALGERLAEEIYSRLSGDQSVEPAPAPAPAARSPAPPPATETGRWDALLDVAQSTGFPVALLGVDREFRIFAWNPAAERLFGAPGGERAGRSLLTVELSGLESEVRGRVRRSLDGGPTEAPVLLSFDRDRVHHVQLAVVPLRNEGPAEKRVTDSPVPGVLVLVEDVTDKVESEVAAKVLGRFQKALSASLPVPLAVVDAQGRVMSWNSAAQRLLGVADRSALGKEFAALSLPAAACAGFPFGAPGEEAQGTLYIFGELAALLQGGRSGGGPAVRKTPDAASAREAALEAARGA